MHVVFVRLAVLACTTVGLVAPAPAADDAGYPRRPVTMVVQFPPGGVPDILGRLLAEGLSRQLGQPFVVESRTGAAGNIGTEAVVRARPDGYTLLFSADAPIVINPLIYQNLKFDPVKDLAPITLAAETDFALLAGPAFTGESVQDLLAQAQARPGALSFGSSGVGSSHHLAGELFNKMAGVDIRHVPYRGFGQASVDVSSGQLEVMYGSVPAAQPLIQGGKLRALAVTGANRAPALPEVPTMLELGLQGYEVTAWFGLLAPAGTPPAILQTLHEATLRVLESPALREASARQGITLVGAGPEAFARRIADDLELWRSVVSSAKVSVE